MDELNTEYNDLMVRYFTGEASPDEISLLSDRLAEDPQFRQLFEEYRQTWLLTVRDSVSGIDLDREWSAISGKINEAEQSEDLGTISKSDNKKPVIRQLLTSWKVAASLVVLLSMAAVLFYFSNTPDTIEIVADRPVFEQVLPDGSEVILQRGAVIKFPAEFGKKNRKVTLEGEAFFNVRHNESLPFIVQGENVRIKVLGTKFMVNTKAAENKVSVVLSSGRVSLYFKGNEKNNVLLSPGEKAEIDTEEKIIDKSVNTDPNFNAWMTGVIVFNNTDLATIAATLENVYKTKIVLSNKELANCTLTATFRGQAVDEVLNVISLTLGLEVLRKDNTFYVDGTCK
jgi:transmembrane sensor